MSNFHPARGTRQYEPIIVLNEDDQVVVRENRENASRWRPRVTSCRCWAIAALLVAACLTAFGLLLYFNYFRDDGSGLAAGSGVNVEAELVVLPQGLADETGAYCLDGSPPSFYFRNGDREDPVIHNNMQMYYRGSRVLDAVIGHLPQLAGLQEAERVILSGESAGGLAVYLHADRVRSMVPDNAIFKAVADAGFFVAEADTNGQNGWESSMKDVYQLQQVEGSLDGDCLLAKGKDKWECFFAQYAYPYVTTPMFVINSVYDTWAARNILGVHCRPLDCSGKDLEVLLEHRRIFLQHTDQTNRYDKDGMFLTSCFAHLQAVIDSSWMSYKVAGRATREAFADWYYERTTPNETWDVDCNSSLTCNPTCN